MMKKKQFKILMVHPHDIYSASEPWTIRITYLAEEFVKKGHEVKLVYFPLPSNKRGKILKEKHKEFETIPFNRRKWFLFKNILRMYKLSKWADIIHFQKYFSIASIPSLFAAYLRGIPIHYDWDDWEYAIYKWDTPSIIYGWYLNILEKIMPRLADSVSVSSNHLRKMTLEKGVAKNKISDSHVGADLKKFNPNNKGYKIKKLHNIKQPLVLYLGQIHGGQYTELFLKAAKIILKEKNIKADFMIAGGGEFLPELKRRNKLLGLKNKIIFTNYLNYDKIPEHIAAADVCVAAFEDNNITKCKSPLKIVEYMASGKAIVASRVGEVPKMLKDSGIIVKPGDEKALAKGIITLLKDKSLRTKLGEKARKRAEEEYNWEVTANNLLKAYKKTKIKTHYRNEKISKKQ
ncbi:hypothetical protein CMO90_03770 [Candidatus Woesearchaeota archaeon]|nr:hypothetical protein [Candidatus Woesearchaeota archaeon]